MFKEGRDFKRGRGGGVKREGLERGRDGGKETNQEKWKGGRMEGEGWMKI